MTIAGKIILTTLLIAIPGALLIYGALQVKKLMDFCWEMYKYDFKGIDAKFVHIDFKLRIKNPSKLSITIKKYYIDVYLNDKFVANIQSKSTEKKTLKGGETSILNLPIKIDYISSFGILKSSEILDYLSNKELDKIVIRMNGKFLVDVLGFSTEIKIDKKMTLKEIEEAYKAPTIPCK